MRCVSSVTVPSGQYNYFAAAIYEAKPRRDGVVTWRKVKQVGPDYTTRKGADDLGEGVADKEGVPFLPGVRHGSPVVGGGAR
jgi:hypothetical protein